MAKKVTKKDKKKNNTNERRIGYTIQAHGAKREVTRRFVPRDIVVLPLNEQKILDLLAQGYEVRLGSLRSGIRVFPYLMNDFKTQVSVAQTHGDFRKGLVDIPWDETGKVKHDIGDLVKRTAARRVIMRNGYNLATAGVTPDLMVECPNCGTSFRVGKKLV